MKKEIVFDIKMWIGVGLVMPLLIANARDLPDRLGQAFQSMVVMVGLFYAHKWLIKNYLAQKKVSHYILGLISLIALVTFLFGLFLSLTRVGNSNYFITALINVLLFIFFSTAISYAYRGILLQIQYEKTKRRQVEAELKLLQSQVNPHFLFNTLNNIYAQNLVHQEEANEMILQLADLMRYQIESSKKNEVSIDDEIEFLENYIALEKKRSTDRIKVSFAVDKTANLTMNIPPMLFIPFIENAYKHGISAEGESSINILLDVKEHGISFKIENQIPVRKQMVKSTKTGLENIKKRLELLFPNKHQLSINTDNHIYNVQLDIQI
jgi:two-component system, LytTR family, sensor kinase